MPTVRDVFKQVTALSHAEGVRVYVVGGYVRDVLLGRGEDRDIDFVVLGSGLPFAKAFDAKMGQIGSLVEFPEFDTARYVVGADNEQLVIEFAGARREAYRSESRKPQVVPATLEEDLARRDFTINAMAVEVAELARPHPTLFLHSVQDRLFAKERGRRPRSSSSAEGEAGGGLAGHIIDPFNGQADLKDKILRTPLDPNVTFSEDPLRMLRAIRFAAELGFGIERTTLEAIHRERERIKIVSAERIQEELFKLLAARQPSVGLILMFQTGLLDLILPEVSALDGVEEIFGHQHKNNLVHSFKVVDNVAEQSAQGRLRLAGLLHDIGKPATKRFVPRLGWTFHGHEHMGRKMIGPIARRLRFSTELKEYLAKLIRWHLQPIALMDEGITDSAVRRLVVTLGGELEDLLILGKSDITTGNPYKRERRLKNYDRLKQKIAEVLERDKLRAFQSPVRGEEIMEACKLKPGPTVGKIKEAIEEAILDGQIPNDYAAAQEYFLKIKDEYIKNAAGWEKVG